MPPSTQKTALLQACKVDDTGFDIITRSVKTV